MTNKKRIGTTRFRSSFLDLTAYLFRMKKLYFSVLFHMPLAGAAA
jgi:hypothetical protein